MIEESAVVVALEGDFAWVETERRSTCGSCAVSGGCGTSVLSRYLGRRTARMRALNGVGARVGDTVVVGLQEGALLQGSFAVYIVPLLAMFVFAVGGEAIGVQLLLSESDPLAAFAGALGLAAGGLWVRRFTRRIGTDPRFQPVILRRAASARPAGSLAQLASEGRGQNWPFG